MVLRLLCQWHRIELKCFFNVLLVLGAPKIFLTSVQNYQGHWVHEAMYLGVNHIFDKRLAV